MADKLKFELVAPEKLLMSAEVDRVTVPGTEGRFGVLAGHAPVISSLRPGVIDVDVDERTQSQIFVRGGFAEVTPEGLTVLAAEAVAAEDLNADVLAQQVKNAEEDVADAKDDVTRQKAQEILNHLHEAKSALNL
jgi:F-type H+-transporting ATPase subunit epsilon